MPFELVQKSPRLWWIFNMTTGEKHIDDPMPLKYAKVEIKKLRKEEKKPPRRGKAIKGGMITPPDWIPKDMIYRYQSLDSVHYSTVDAGYSPKTRYYRGLADINKPYGEWIDKHPWMRPFGEWLDNLKKIVAEPDVDREKLTNLFEERKEYKKDDPEYDEITKEIGHQSILMQYSEQTYANEIVNNPTSFFLSQRDQDEWLRGYDEVQNNTNHIGRKDYCWSVNVDTWPSDNAYDCGKIWGICYNRSWQPDTEDSKGVLGQVWDTLKTGAELGVDVAKLVL